MSDLDYIPLSYLAQYYFCKRRAALLMLEQVWIENEYTAEGRAEHERVHTSRIERRSDIIKMYEYVISSDKLQLSGKCDCIEVIKDDNGYAFPFAEGTYILFPVEYKHGKVRNEEEYNIQLCAQAICLEEMLNCKIKRGAVFYIDSHRRVQIDFTDELREKVIAGAKKLQEIYRTEKVPYEPYGAKCKKCSLLEYCSPKTRRSTDNYMKMLINTASSLEEYDEEA